MAIKAFLVLRVFKVSTVPLATRALTAMPAIQGCRAREGPTAQTGRPDPLARTVWPARQAILAIEASRAGMVPTAQPVYVARQVLPAVLAHVARRA